MTWTGNHWQLPSAQAFLGEAADLLDGGGGILVGGCSLPPGLTDGLGEYLRQRRSGLVYRSLAVDPAVNPARMLAHCFGTPTADAAALACDRTLADHVVVVTLDSHDATCASWLVFLRRFLAARASTHSGLAVYAAIPASATGIGPIPVVAWGGRLRRIDLTLWADIHARDGRIEPLASLSLALAVEIGAWRLDLVAAIAASSTDDLIDPLGYLESWRGREVDQPDSVDGVPMACSIALLQRGALAELEQRLWRAQLRALFPWIEEMRQQTVARHRKSLVVDLQQRSLGVASPEGIEFGGIAFQLRSKVPPVEADFHAALARMRNDLAHHKPVAAADLRRALADGRRAGYG